MKKLFALLLSGFLPLLAQNANKTTQGICLCPLPKNTLSIKANYNRINDTIDILNIKEQELGSRNFGAMGDASGFDISLGYGINDYSAIYYDFEYLGVNYADTKLKNKKNNIFTKINLYHNPKNIFQTFSIDFGVTLNSADDLDIKKVSTLNSMLQKMKPGTSIKFNGTGLEFKGSTLTIFDQDGVLPPFIRIANMSDTSFFIRGLTGIKFQNSILQLYSGLKTTSIESLITLEPSNSQIIADAIKEFGLLDLNRDEKTLFAGFNYALKYQDFIFEAGYEYLKIFGRESKLDATDDNHILNGSISKNINEDFRVFIGGKAMLNQFNGVIPYLYNEYTKHKYEKKYGYAKIGFIYNINLDALGNL